MDTPISTHQIDDELTDRLFGEPVTGPAAATGDGRPGGVAGNGPSPARRPARRGRTLDRRRRPEPGLLPLLAGAAALGAWLVLVVQAVIGGPGADTTWGVVLYPVLLVPVAYLARRLERREPGFALGSIVVAGFAFRVVGSVFRLRSGVDSLVYHQSGQELADSFRSFDFAVDTGRPIPGTGGIRYVSGLFQAAFGSDRYLLFLLFTVLSFLGAYLCYVAFSHAVPDGDKRRYALLVFLWPSLVYWPSSLGKEAWMMLGLGIASWGVARVLEGRSGSGLAVLIAGLAALAFVRPHVALLVTAGFAVSLLARPRRGRSKVRLAGRLAAVVLLVVGGAIAAGYLQETLRLDATGTETLTAAQDETIDRTTQGDASFTPVKVSSPVDYPAAFVTVWFRPLPFEIHNATSALAALEAAALVLLVGLSWRRLLAIPRALVREPYVTYAAVFCLGFVYAYSVIGNFGILVRQRTQGLVLLFVLLSLTADRARRRPSSSREPARPAVGSDER